MPTVIPRDAAERIGHFLKALARDEASQAWCRQHDIDYRSRAAVEGIGSAGGVLTPQDFDSVPIDVMPRTGAFRRGTDVRTTTSDYQFRPRLTGSLTASYVAEGASIPASQVLLSAMEATPKRIATLTQMPSELLDDTPVAIADWLVPEIRWALDSLEDDSAWNGSASSAFGHTTGLFLGLPAGAASRVTAQAGHTTFGSLDAGDLSSLVGAVDPIALPGASWIVSSAGFSLALTRLSEVAGNVMMQTNPDGTISPTFMGWPVLFTNKLPDVSTTLSGALMMAFGNLKLSSSLVVRQPTDVQLSYHFAFDADTVTVRASRRIAVVHHSLGSATVKAPIGILIGG